jgi:hypothetical protein
MADFLSNLLQRSGAVTVATPAPILQPRLPALFEATGGPEGVSAPPPAPLEPIALPAPVESRETLPRSPSSIPQAAEQPRYEHPAAPAHLPRPALPVAGSHPLLPRQGKPVIDEDLPAPPPRRQARRNPSTAGKAENAPKRDRESRPAAIVERRPVPLENQPAPAKPVGRQAEQHATPLQNEPIPVKAVRESVAPQPSLPVAARPAASPAQLSEASEPVVQIHIGRIEVRAVTPPPSAPASRPRPSGPKLSLEDYLHQREGKG